MGDSYTAAGYGSAAIGYGRRPAVLVVDFQLAFTDPRYPIGRLPMVHAACERTAALLEVARAQDVPVAKCYTAYGSEADMPLWKVKAVREEFFYGHPCTAIDPRVHDAQHDFTFCKNAPSIFFRTPLMTFLTRQQVDTVIVTGCTTSGCVRATVIDAMSSNYRTVVVTDCVGDRALDPHRANLFDMGQKYSDLMRAAEIMAALEARG